jgi:pimeloyl-ACP methyl ester carboxylesterase
MSPIVVPAPTRLRVTYRLHEAPKPDSGRGVVLHHGICHTREHFQRLIEALNASGIHAAVIDQQSEDAGWLRRNFIGLNAYCEGMAAAVTAIEKEMPIGSYALHSMGALIGEEMQRQHPELRHPTVLMAPVPVDGALPITLRLLKRRPHDYLCAVFALNILSLARSPTRVRELFFDQDTPQHIVKQAKRQLRHAPFWTYCQLALRWKLRPAISDDGYARLLLYSASDEIFFPSEYENTKALYPGMKEFRIEGGHDFFIEYAQRAAEEIADFHLSHEAQPQEEATETRDDRSVPPHHMAVRKSLPARERSQRASPE